MTTIEVEKAKVKVGYVLAFSVLTGCIYLGIKIGGWESFRKDTEANTADYKAWKPTIQQQVNSLMAIKNANAK